jgi:hypothetical protein
VGGQLTEAQLDNFLASYRRSFEAEDQGKALRLLYNEASRSYGIPIDVLRKILAKELENNPRPYRALRNKLTAKKSAKTGTTKAASAAPQPSKTPPKAEEQRACPVCRQLVRRSKKGRLADHQHNGSPCSGKVAPCSVCREMRALRAGSRRLAVHNRDNGRRCAGSDLLPLRPTAKGPQKDELRCPICEQQVGRTDNGTVAGHNSNRSGMLDWCAGSGMKITRPQPSRTKADDRSESRSVRATSAGLGSLGRR